MANPQEEAMEALGSYGFPKELIQRTINQLLRVYGGDSAWPLLKEDKFSVILEKILSDQASREVQKLHGKKSPLQRKGRTTERPIEKQSEPCISFQQRKLWMKHFNMVPSSIFTDEEGEDVVLEQKYCSLVNIGNVASQRKDTPSISFNGNANRDKTPLKGIEKSIEQSTVTRYVEGEQTIHQETLLSGIDVPVTREKITEHKGGYMACRSHSSDSGDKIKDAMECSIDIEQGSITSLSCTKGKMVIDALNENTQCEIHQDSMPLIEAGHVCNKSYPEVNEGKIKPHKLDVGRICASKLTRRRDGCPNPIFLRIQKAKKIATGMQALSKGFVQKEKCEPVKSHSCHKLSSNKGDQDKGTFDHSSRDKFSEEKMKLEVKASSDLPVKGNKICQEWTPPSSPLQRQRFILNKTSERETTIENSKNNYDMCALKPVSPVDESLTVLTCNGKTGNSESTLSVSRSGQTNVGNKFYQSEMPNLGCKNKRENCKSVPITVNSQTEVEKLFYQSKNTPRTLSEMSRLCFSSDPCSLRPKPREIRSREEFGGKSISKELPNSTEPHGLDETRKQEKEQLELLQENNTKCSSKLQTRGFSPNNLFQKVTFSDLKKESPNLRDDDLLDCTHASPELPPGFDSCPGRDSSPELPPGFDTPDSCPSHDLPPGFETPPGFGENTPYTNVYEEACRMWHGTLNCAMEYEKYEHMTCGSGWLSSDDE